MLETHFCESGHLGPLLVLIINFFLLYRSQVADQFKQPAMVELLDPFQRRQLHRLEMAPGAASANDLGLVQTADRLRERVVVAVADASDGGLDTGLGQPLRIPDREVLGGFKRSSQHFDMEVMR